MPGVYVYKNYSISQLADIARELADDRPESLPWEHLRLSFRALDSCIEQCPGISKCCLTTRPHMLHICSDEFCSCHSQERYARGI